MITSHYRRKFLLTGLVILFCVIGVAQTPPQGQPSLPKAPSQFRPSLLLALDLRLDAGAQSTQNRAVTLDFTALEKGDGNVTISNDTANVTHYRALEDSSSDRLSEQAWIPVTRRPPFFNLAERDQQHQRYGERRVVFQVKTETLTSNIVTDTIVVEPLVKEYRVSASGNVHPLIQYAAQQGFTFPLDYYETCKGDCAGSSVASPDIASGIASVSTQVLSRDESKRDLICVLAGLVGLQCITPVNSRAPASPAACITKADYHLFEGRSPNQFWRIKSVDVSGATVHSHGANRFLVKFSLEKKDATCLPPRQISIGDVVVEGPVEDENDFVDAANPWKNAFIRHTTHKGAVIPQPN